MTPAPRFLPDQQLALDHAGSVALSAGAGAGKTHVLVEKYYGMMALEHPDWPIDSVMAITFTVKAASELRSRILDRIGEGLEQCGECGGRERLLELRSQIAAAPIGTIHNMCARLLREFAAEAGLDPGFEVIEGVQETVLRQGAVDAAISDAAAAPHTSPQYRQLLALSTLFTPAKLAAMLESMLARRAEYDAIAADFCAHDSGHFMKRLSRLQLSERETFLRECLPQLREAAAAVASDLPDEFAAADSVNESGWTELCMAAGRLRDRLVDARGRPRASARGVPATAVQTRAAETLLAMTTAMQFLSIEPGVADRQVIEVSRMLARLYARCAMHFAAAKNPAGNPRRTDLLDFADLELWTHRMLASGRVIRQVLRSRIRYLIVDEFQDTSALQWGILRMLVSDDDGALLPGRVFVVGDLKQSIYGFRRAGAGVFDRARSLLSDGQPDDGCRGQISINTNFRTLERPLALINGLFACLLGSGVGRRGTPFEPLLPWRRSGPGAVEILVAGQEQEPEADGVGGWPGTDAGDGPPAHAEAMAVAARVRELAGAATVFDKSSGEECERPAGFGDMALLFRKRRHFRAYEAALRACGIPFSTYQGSGLLDQPQVADILDVLRVLAFPGDDLLLVRVLRGGLLRFPDELLLRIMHCGGASWREKCRAAAAAPPDLVPAAGRERAALAAGLLDVLGRRAGFVPVDRLVQMIVEETGLMAALPAGRDGEQAAANVRRFIELVRGFGAADLEAFLAYVDTGPAIAQAEVGGGAAASTDAVAILTIHAAKGLEFPIVFLPELADKIYLGRDELLSDGSEWFASAGAARTGQESYLVGHLQQVQRDQDLDEERRVLYVAATRCRDRLILSGTWKKDWSGSCLEWIDRSCGLRAALEAGRPAVAMPSGVPGQEIEIPLRVTGSGHAPAAAAANGGATDNLTA